MIQEIKCRWHDINSHLFMKAGHPVGMSSTRRRRRKTQ
jgi:hypothetical protein